MRNIFQIYVNVLFTCFDQNILGVDTWQNLSPITKDYTKKHNSNMPSRQNAQTPDTTNCSPFFYYMLNV